MYKSSIVNPPQNANSYTEVDMAILKTIAYFDIFNYPLKKEEVISNCSFSHFSEVQISSSLAHLIQIGMIHTAEDFFFLDNKTHIIEQRIQGNLKAKKFFKKARFFSKMVSYFPFVDAVFLTGSLSKGVVDKNGDIDYFIITRPSRLWFARTFLIAFKKLFLLNSRKYFCMNYFIDSENLAIPDKNIFTATELAYSIPMYNQALCNKFYHTNAWYQNFYPQKPIPETDFYLIENKSVLKKTMEWIFNGRIGRAIDNWCFRITIRYWKKKYKYMDKEQFDFNFKSGKYISKHHPKGFQFAVLQKYDEKLNELINKK